MTPHKRAVYLTEKERFALRLLLQRVFEEWENFEDEENDPKVIELMETAKSATMKLYS